MIVGIGLSVKEKKPFNNTKGVRPTDVSSKEGKGEMGGYLPAKRIRIQPVT